MARAVCQKSILPYPDALGAPAWMPNFWQAKKKGLNGVFKKIYFFVNFSIKKIKYT